MDDNLMKNVTLEERICLVPSIAVFSSNLSFPSHFTLFVRPHHVTERSLYVPG
jgi:hypothetical protein